LVASPSAVCSALGGGFTEPRGAVQMPEPIAASGERAIHHAPAGAVDGAADRTEAVAEATPYHTAQRAATGDADELRVRRRSEGKHGGDRGTREKMT